MFLPKHHHFLTSRNASPSAVVLEKYRHWVYVSVCLCAQRLGHPTGRSSAVALSTINTSFRVNVAPPSLQKPVAPGLLPGVLCRFQSMGDHPKEVAHPTEVAALVQVAPFSKGPLQ